VTESLIRDPAAALEKLAGNDRSPAVEQELSTAFDRLLAEEKRLIRSHITSNQKYLSHKYNLTLTPSRTALIADFYTGGTLDVEHVFRKVKLYSDEIKNAELAFYKQHDINIVLEEDAIDHLLDKLICGELRLQDLSLRLNADFELGLKLVREKTGKNRFFINRDALIFPEQYVAGLLKQQLTKP
jgi:hypothetical protein